jgi:hypothetical protein
VLAVRLSNNEAMSNGSCGNPGTHKKSDRITGRVVLRTDCPQLSWNKKHQNSTRDEDKKITAHIASKNRPKASGQADHTLANTVSKTDSMRWSHYKGFDERTYKVESKLLTVI